MTPPPMRRVLGVLCLVVSATAHAVRLREQQVEGDWGPAYVDLVGFIQPRLEFVSDDTLCPPGAPSCTSSERITEHDFGGDGFALRRLEIGVQGRLHRFLGFQFRVARTRDGLIAPLDAYLDLPFADVFSVRLGQFKVPFSRQWLVSPSRLQMIE